MPYARLTPVSGGLAFESSKHDMLIDQLKRQIPSTGRKPVWDGRQFKHWLIDPQYAPVLVQLCSQYLGVTLDIPDTTSTQSPLEMRTLQLDYLGACYERVDKSVYASGYAPWAGGPFDKQRPSYIFPEQVLMAWFGYDAEPVKPAEPSQPARPKIKQTLYQVLGLKNDASTDDIKKAHRRLAKQWHPDYCTEPDAAARFHEIQQAYDKLRDPDTRRKYDVGLKLAKLADELTEREAVKKASADEFFNKLHSRFADDDRQPRFRAPLRCGLLLVEGRQAIAGFQVEKILAWEDIVNAQGQTMTSSWLGDIYIVKWV